MWALRVVIYLSCLLTSAGCAILLVRSYLSRRGRLQLWSALCFALLAVDNLLVVVDIVILPNVNLMFFRQITTLAAIAVLLLGFIWEAG